MNLFGKKNGNNDKTAQSYNCKKFFPISRPWGYDPSSVDEAITKYNALLAKQKNIIMKMKDENVALKNEMCKLENEMKNMQMELSFATIPSVTSIQEEYILNQFEKNFQNQDADQKEKEKSVKKFVSIPDEKIDESAVTNENVQNEDVDEENDDDFLKDILNDQYDCDGDDTYDVPGMDDTPIPDNEDDFLDKFKF